MKVSGTYIGERTVFFFFFLMFIYLFNICQYCSCLQTHQKRASDSITDGCEPPCGCWVLNSGPLEEQPVLITAEPSLQPPRMETFSWAYCFPGRTGVESRGGRGRLWGECWAVFYALTLASGSRRN